MLNKLNYKFTTMSNFLLTELRNTQPGADTSTAIFIK